MRAQARAGTPREEVEGQARSRLAAAGFDVDYAVVRRTDLREPVAGDDESRIALVAAWLGSTRLIDNLEFDAG